jgi:anti-sigma factor ChrR (cupin superfamily)
MKNQPTQRVIPDELADALAEALAPSAPPPERVAAVKRAVIERIRAGRSRFVTVRADQGDWSKLAPGVQCKVLHDDGETRWFLLRLAPGARLPRHGHAAEETCVVLEGDAQLGDIEAHAGDFHLALPGSVHDGITTRSGALLFLRGASSAGLQA